MTTATKHKTADRLTAEERHELPDSAFGIPETREFPLVDAEHIRAAEAYFRYAPDNKRRLWPGASSPRPLHTA